MREFISWLKEEESGQGMVEYGVIVGLVVIIAIAALSRNRGLGQAISNLFDRVTTNVNGIR